MTDSNFFTVLYSTMAKFEIGFDEIEINVKTHMIEINKSGMSFAMQTEFLLELEEALKPKGDQYATGL